jgi:hypothetical protein
MADKIPYMSFFEDEEIKPINRHLSLINYNRLENYTPFQRKQEQPMSFTNRIKTDAGHRGRAIVLHGEIGIGKTEFCAAAVKQTGGIVLHHRKEQGINDLKRSGDVPSSLKTFEFENWTDLTSALQEMAADDENPAYKTIVIDSLTWVEQICYEHVCKTEFNGDFSKKGFYDYWAGPRAASSRHWPMMINLLEANVQLGRNVFCIAHTKTKDVKNGDGEDYMQQQPEMDRDSFKLFTIWAQHVAYMHFDTEVEKESTRAKGKVTAFSRIMSMIGRPSFIAKSKGFPPEISMGSSGFEAWNNFLAAENTKTATTSAAKPAISSPFGGQAKKAAKKSPS